MLNWTHTPQAMTVGCKNQWQIRKYPKERLPKYPSEIVGNSQPCTQHTLTIVCLLPKVLKLTESMHLYCTQPPKRSIFCEQSFLLVFHSLSLSWDYKHKCNIDANSTSVNFQSERWWLGRASPLAQLQALPHPQAKALDLSWHWQLLDHEYPQPPLPFLLHPHLQALLCLPHGPSVIPRVSCPLSPSSLTAPSLQL